MIKFHCAKLIRDTCFMCQIDLSNWHIDSRDFLKINLEDVSPFLGSVIPLFGLIAMFIARVNSHIHNWQRWMFYTFPEFHLQSDTSWPLCSQGGSQAILYMYLWSCTGGFEIAIYHAAAASKCETRQTLYRLSYASSTSIFPVLDLMLFFNLIKSSVSHWMGGIYVLVNTTGNIYIYNLYFPDKFIEFSDINKIVKREICGTWTYHCLNHCSEKQECISVGCVPPANWP